jgi:ribosomal protein S18 acetylase RimI-like enzyme
MLSIQIGSSVHTSTIRDIAYTTWPVTYGDIVPAAQLQYMLELFYSDEALIVQMEEKGHQFILVREGELVLGFASYEHGYLNTNTTRLHKIYLLPESQGKGAGKLLIDSVVKAATENQSDAVSLNVNRFNKAVSFYQKMGFEIVGEEDVELDHGYLMEDYKMEFKL